MNWNKLKTEFDCIAYLEKQGYKPNSKQITKGCYMYHSPLREDKNPSFALFYLDNVYYDFATQDKGDVITFLRKYHHISFQEAITILKTENPKNPKNYSFNNTKPINSSIVSHNAPNNIHYHISSLNNPLLIQYGKQRGISPAILQQYCKQIIINKGKNAFFSIAFPNSKGFEHRNKYIKGATQKAISTLCDKHANIQELYVFEGFFDFLSYKQLKHKPCQAIVLNGIALKAQLKDFLTDKSYKIIHFFGDNPKKNCPKSQHILNQIIDTLRQHAIYLIDYRSLYSHHKDLNEYLLKQPMTQSTFKKACQQLLKKNLYCIKI